MKVVHLMGALLPSGMERMFVSAAPHLHAAGVENVLVGQGDDQRFIADLEAVGHRVRVIPKTRTAAGARAWWRLLAEERPDLVHIHDEAAIAVTAPVARAVLRSAPVVRTIHNEFRPTGRALVSRQVQGRVSNRALDATIAVSPDVQANERRFGRQARLILNWVDDDYPRLRRERAALAASGEVERDSVAIVGNCSPIKNHALALRAVLPTRLAVRFHGDERHASDEERRLLDRLQQQGRLRHRGSGQPAQSLLRAGAFLLPSRHEGMSIALAEAVAVGVPALVNEGAGSGWAAQLPGVAFLPPEQPAWDRAVAALGGPQDVTPVDAPIDLTAERGVRELLALYREVLARRRTGSRIRAA